MNKYGFKAELPLLEEFLTTRSPRWGGSLSGSSLKSHLKSGARAQADDFARGGRSRTNRDFLVIALEGQGIPPHVARDIADNS